MKQSLIEIYENSRERITIRYLPAETLISDDVETSEFDPMDLRVIANEFFKLADEFDIKNGVQHEMV
jgi:hypothetical protein